MAKPRLMVELRIDTEEHAQIIAANLEAQAALRPRFRDRFEDLTVAAADEGFVVRLDVRYLERSDRQAVRSWFLNQVADHPQVRTWILEARAVEHLCTHDDAEPRPCTETEFEIILDRRR